MHHIDSYSTSTVHTINNGISRRSISVTLSWKFESEKFVVYTYRFPIWHLFQENSVENVMDTLSFAIAGVWGVNTKYKLIKQCSAPSQTDYAIFFSYFL